MVALSSKYFNRYNAGRGKHQTVSKQVNFDSLRGPQRDQASNHRWYTLDGDEIPFHPSIVDIRPRSDRSRESEQPQRRGQHQKCHQARLLLNQQRLLVETKPHIIRWYRRDEDICLLGLTSSIFVKRTLSSSDS